MAYQTGTASSVADLIDKLRLFAVGQCGYALLMHAPIGGSDHRLHLHHGATGQYVNIYTISSNVYFYGSTGFNASLGHDEQPNPSNVLSTGLTGTLAYHFFGGAGYCYALVQQTPSYKAILFGAIEKLCAFDGGAFLSDGLGIELRADIDGHVDYWPESYAFGGSLMRQMDYYSPLAFNGVTPLYPCDVRVVRDPPSYPPDRSIVGVAPGVRLLKMAGQYADGDVIAISGDEWMTFKLNASGAGYAFKK